METHAPLSLDKITDLVGAFKDTSLPLTQWTHEAHLIVALWHMYTYPFAEAVCLLRSGIISYNNSVGTPNTTHKGYHETLTLLWAYITKFYFDQHPHEDIVLLCTHFLQSEYAERDFPLRYYSRECLFSVEARAWWVAPDHTPLPFTHP